LLSELSLERIQLSAAGMFTVGRELVPAVSVIRYIYLHWLLYLCTVEPYNFSRKTKLTAAVVTYLVILLQSSLGSNMPNKMTGNQIFNGTTSKMI